MILGSPFYEVLKTSTTLKSYNSEGGPNEDFLMD